MTKIKICGITNAEDALRAARLGADMIGFNFYEGSPRYISSDAASRISEQLGSVIRKVGVFVDHPIDAVAGCVEKAGLQTVQLHGIEDEEYIQALRAACGAEIVKALRVESTFTSESARAYPVDAILLDAYSPKGLGGTGDTFNWNVAVEVSRVIPELWLAGGLSPENVKRAISEVLPEAVDVCSSIESRPGVKDPVKMERFISEARSA